jgi:hypothetical protein
MLFNCTDVLVVPQDPVLSFGSVSQHVHKISGASNINVNSTYDSLRAAPCTSCQIQGGLLALLTRSYLLTSIS